MMEPMGDLERTRRREQVWTPAVEAREDARCAA